MVEIYFLNKFKTENDQDYRHATNQGNDVEHLADGDTKMKRKKRGNVEEVPNGS